MRNHALESSLVERFGITHTEAREMVAEQEAKAAVRQAVAAASRGLAIAKPDADFEQPAVWRHEVHRRLAALDVMEEGIGCLQQLQKHIKAVIDAEQQLVQHKRAKVRDKQIDWWDLRDSGWAMGGRERFATYVGDILRNLDEGKLGGKLTDHMGFKRSIPLPDIPEPVVESAPRDADELVARLVQGAKPRQKRIKTDQELTDFLHGPGWKTTVKTTRETVMVNQDKGAVIRSIHKGGLAADRDRVILQQEGKPDREFKWVKDAMDAVK